MPDPGASDPVQFDFQTAQRVVRAVRTVEQLSGKQTGQRGGNAPQYAPPIIIRIRNDSGADRSRGEVLCIDEIEGSTIQDTDEQNRQIYGSGVKPDTANRRHIPCVLLEDVRQNAYADCVTAGLCVAKVDVVDTDHNFVTLIDDDASKLRSANSGVGRILSIDGNATGTKRCLIALGGGFDLVLGKLDADVAKGATVSLSVWTGALGSETDSGENITVTNLFGNVTSGSWGLAAEVHGGWLLVSAECGSSTIDGADIETGTVPLAALEDIAANSILASLTGGPVDLLPLTVSGAAALNASGATGTGSLAYSNSPTFVTPTLGAATVTSINGAAPGAGGLTVFAASGSTGTGNAVLASSPTLVTPNIGVATATSINGTTIPSSVTLTKTADKLSVFAATTSAELASVLSDAVGSGGGFVRATSPTLTTPVLGVATATSINGTTIPASATLLSTAAAVTEAQGGTNQTTYATGDILYASAANTLSKLAGNTTTTKMYLCGVGTGSAAQDPFWRQIPATDISGLATSATIDATNASNISSGTLPAARLDTTSSPTFTGITLTASAAGTFKLGTTNSPSNADTVTPLSVVGASGVAASLQVIRHTSPGGGGAIFTLSATRGSDVNSYTIVQTGDGLGTLKFSGADGTQYYVGAEIKSNVEGTPASGNVKSNLAFLTGGGTRLTITSSGDMLQGTTTAPTGTIGKTMFFGANGGNPTPGASTAGIFAKTVTQVEMFAIDSAGNATQLSKHYDPALAEAAGIVIDPDDNYPQIDCEENPYLGLRALTYYSQATGQRQRVTVDLPAEELRDWSTDQDEHQAAHEQRAARWDSVVREHEEATAKHAVESEAWEKLDPVAKVFVPRPAAPEPLDLSREPGEFVRQECPKWIAKIVERRKGGTNADAGTK